jgi:uncharacterized protein YchJ
MNKNFKIQMMSIDQFDNIKNDSNWEKNEQNELQNKSTKSNDLCYCGSGEIYKNCCQKRTPIEHLEYRGHKVLKDQNGHIIVGIDISNNILEGIFKTKREEPLSFYQSFPIKSIFDYNSMWELTKTGWDSEGEFKFPYINVDGEWYRWDESYFIRPNCNTHQWDEKNHQKYFSYLMKNQIIHPPQKTQNRNEKCNCGSGKKFKKCCGK